MFKLWRIKISFQNTPPQTPSFIMTHLTCKKNHLRNMRGRRTLRLWTCLCHSHIDKFWYAEFSYSAGHFKGETDEPKALKYHWSYRQLDFPSFLECKSQEMIIYLYQSQIIVKSSLLWPHKSEIEFLFSRMPHSTPAKMKKRQQIFQLCKKSLWYIIFDRVMAYLCSHLILWELLLKVITKLLFTL